MIHALRCLLACAAALALVEAAQAQDPAAGRKLADTCFGCHGIPDYQASFPEVYRVPKLSGQNADYLAAALTEYKKGERHHPTMNATAMTLSDKDIADLAAFFHQYGAATIKPVSETLAAGASPEATELITKGGCTACHGANFSKPILPAYPKLAGQYPDYLFTALKAYHTQGNPYFGRANPIMMGQAAQFSVAQLKVIANYIGSLPGELETVPNPRFR
jgi:cytochrome c553